MARRRFRQRRTYTDAHVVQLVLGQDFFNDAFGDDVEAMKEAWSDSTVRERVHALWAERKAAGLSVPDQPWAAEQFDDERTVVSAENTLTRSK